MYEATSQLLLNKLLGGHIDAAIISLPVGMLELTERELFDDRLLLAGTASRLAAFRELSEDLKADNLAKSDLGPLLALNEGHCLGDQVLARCLDGDNGRRLAPRIAWSVAVWGSRAASLIPEQARCRGGRLRQLSYLRFGGA